MIEYVDCQCKASKMPVTMEHHVVERPDGSEEWHWQTKPCEVRQPREEQV